MCDPWRLICALLVLGAAAVSAAGEPPVTDPTRPPYGTIEGGAAGAKEEDDTLLLHATRVSADGRSAVINDRVVTVGASVAGAVVTSIEPGRVTLERGSEAIVLQLFKQPVKRPARDSS